MAALRLALGCFRDARRIWFWHYSPLIFTGIVCFLFGGIVSEFVQSMLPVRSSLRILLHEPHKSQYKEFQIGDIFVSIFLSA